jgi:hypothetical protein
MNEKLNITDAYSEMLNEGADPVKSDTVYMNFKYRIESDVPIDDIDSPDDVSIIYPDTKIIVKLKVDGEGANMYAITETFEKAKDLIDREIEKTLKGDKIVTKLFGEDYDHTGYSYNIDDQKIYIVGLSTEGDTTYFRLELVLPSYGSYE